MAMLGDIVELSVVVSDLDAAAARFSSTTGDGCARSNRS